MSNLTISEVDVLTCASKLARAFISPAYFLGNSGGDGHVWQDLINEFVPCQELASSYALDSDARALDQKFRPQLEAQSP
ncbi:MAG: hypothetical protein Q7J84_05210 [Sulfuricaulis sp.]|nr:hypothetical protein [Sulfuricaulis sp.]